MPAERIIGAADELGERRFALRSLRRATRTGGKSGLQVLRPYGLGAKGDAPDNVRGLFLAMRASATPGAATESATENIPPVNLASAAGFWRNQKLACFGQAIGKGEKVG